MEQEYVREVYEKIAQDFSNTRTYIWKCVKLFLDTKTDKQIGLEIGCGNGKNMLYRPELNIIGIDNCNSFINICHQRKLKVIYNDCCDLSFDNDTFNYVYSIAVFHHLDSEKRRITALREMIRVLKSGGEGLITLWSVENQENETIYRKFNKGDNLVKWCRRSDNQIFQRYYYIYDYQMIQDYLSIVQDKIKILNIFNEHGNWVIHFSKL